MFSVLLVDGCAPMRMGLRHLISEEYRGIAFGEAMTGAEALGRFVQRQWDLLVLNIDLPDQSGFSLLRRIVDCESISRPRVIMMSMHSNPVYAKRARQLGALYCVSEGSGNGHLLKAIQAALSGKKEIKAANSAVAAPTAEAPPHTKLSAREYEVMQSLASGAHVGEIALNLRLNTKTVSTYKTRIFNKLRVGSTAEMVRYLIDQKLA